MSAGWPNSGAAGGARDPRALLVGRAAVGRAGQRGHRLVCALDHASRMHGAAGAYSSCSARPTGARSAWLDGAKVGEHQGGYTPFSVELTNRDVGSALSAVVRVDDTPHRSSSRASRGTERRAACGRRCISRRAAAIRSTHVHFTPRADLAGVGVDARLLEPAPRRSDASIDVHEPRRPARRHATHPARRSAPSTSTSRFLTRICGRSTIRFSTR